MYKFDPAGEPIAAAFRAIALSQLGDILADLGAPSADRSELIHEARRRCKKLRGLLRLVRPAFGDYARENAAIREAAALLSHLRDADVLRHTLADLADAAGDDGPRLREIAGRLGPVGTDDADARLSRFRTAVEAVVARVANWSLKKDGGAVLVAGARRTYRSARRRLRRAARTNSPADLHEWRKATKYHGFHLDLLKRAAPELLDAERGVVEALATDLGMHHDLTVLRRAMADDAGRFGDAADRALLAGLIESRRSAVEAEAMERGRQVFAERPKALARRLGAYWQGAQ